MRQRTSFSLGIISLLIIVFAVSVAADAEEVKGCQTYSIYTTATKQCSLCYYGYILQNSTCVSDFDNVCKINTGLKCSISNCLQEGIQYSYYTGSYFRSCLQCAQPFSIYQGVCYFYCASLSTYIPQQSDCKPACNLSNCDLCNSDNSNFCKNCASGFFLQEGQCISSCSAGYYLQSNQCLKCNSRCKTCSSSTQCTSCYASVADVTSQCKCPSGTSLYNNGCVSCPYQYLADSEKICQRLCTLPQYAILNSDGSLSSCVNISQSSDPYCLNNLYSLSNRVKATLTFEGINYIIHFQVQQTPQVCYQYALYGTQGQFPMWTSFQSDEDFQIWFYFSTNQVDSGQIECNFTNCFVNLRVYWGGQIQYIFKVMIDINLKVILSNTIQYNGDYKEVSIVCQDCEIPSTQIAASSLQLSCGSGQTCSDNLIETSIGSLIIVTQKVSNSTLIHNTLEPHSLKFNYQDQLTGQQGIFYLSNYTYNNSIQGQITYQFVASSISNGQMTITSTITNAKSSRMLGATSVSSVMYPQLKIGIRSKTASGSSQNNDSNFNNSQTESESGSSSSAVIIGVVVALLLITIAAASFYFYRKTMQKKSALPTVIHEDANITSTIKKISNDEQEPIQVENEPQSQAVQNKIRSIEEVYDLKDHSVCSAQVHKQQSIQLEKFEQEPETITHKKEEEEEVKIEDLVISINQQKENVERFDEIESASQELKQEESIEEPAGIIILDDSESQE